MKKTFVIILALVTAVAFLGCGAAKTVCSVNLSDRERELASAMSRQSFVFDYNSQGFSQGSVWAEEYRKGEKVMTYDLGISWNGKLDTGTIVIYEPYVDAGSTGRINISMIPGTISQDVIPGLYEAMSGYNVVWEPCPKAEISAGVRIPLLCIRCVKEGHSPLSDGFFENYEKNLAEIKNDDVTFFICCAFS